MTAPFLSRFGVPVESEFFASSAGMSALRHLERPLRHHRNGLGSLWERVAEGKTR